MGKWEKLEGFWDIILANVMRKTDYMIFKKEAKQDLHDRFVIVSGLPRSGTSMMMKMLEAGGIPVLTDHEREADEDNPKGYFEFERVKKLKEGDIDWLPQAKGKVMKVIAALLAHLPHDYRYDVIFMRRAMPEILASQKQMLIRRGENPEKVKDEDIAALFKKHLTQVIGWAKKQKNIRLIEVDYNNTLKNPAPTIKRLNKFFGNQLNTELMASVVDPTLYRQRKE
jgi:broad-specificity NMP kinase